MPDEIKQKYILVVDDEQLVALVVARSLKALGEHYTIEVVESGPAALEKFKQNKYHILITDYQMPEMTGLQLAEQVQQFAPTTRIIMMSAFGSSGLRKQAREMGITGFIDKPFEITDLRELVSTIAEQDE